MSTQRPGASSCSWIAHDPPAVRCGPLADERDRHRVGADAVARDAAGGVGGAEAGGWLSRTRNLGVSLVLPEDEAVLVQTNHSHEFEDDDDLYRSRSASRRKKCQPRSRTSRRGSRFRYSTYPPDRFSSSRWAGSCRLRRSAVAKPQKAALPSSVWNLPSPDTGTRKDQ
jgi:hypothetical protein